MKRRPKPAAPLTWAHASAIPTPDGWRFVLPVVQSVNRIWRGGKGRTYKSAEAKDDDTNARRLLPKVPQSGDLLVRIVWHRARRCGDVDGRIKATLDLLNGIAWHDDAQVADLGIVRVDDGSPARIEVTVEPLSVRRAA